MSEVDLVLIGQRSAGRRREQVDEHGFIAFVKIIVDGVQSDAHVTLTRRESNDRAVLHTLQPIVFAQPCRTLLRIEKHEEFASQIPAAQHAKLRPVDVVLGDQCLRGIRVDQFEADHRRWRRRRIVDDTIRGSVFPDFIAFPGRWKDAIARRPLDGDFNRFVTFGNPVKSRVG